MKICKKCNIRKDLTDYFSSAKNCSVCLECQKNKRSKYEESTRRDFQLKSRYNLSLEEYDTLLANQNNCCSICNTHVSKLSTRLHVDHNHDNQQVRGLLCYNCNSGLGRFKDNISFLLSAADYLKHAEKQQHTILDVTDSSKKDLSISKRLVHRL